jgi:serine/threonine protein kinase
MPLAAGTSLGSYVIIGPLGAGGMGEVYRARDSTLQREVAVKVLSDAVAGDAGRRARFEREAHVLASLNHPHIGAIYGIEPVPAGPQGRESIALVLELVDGPPRRLFFDRYEANDYDISAPRRAEVAR